LDWASWVLLGFGHEETKERLDTALLVIVRSSVGRYEYLQIIQFDTNVTIDDSPLMVQWIVSILAALGSRTILNSLLPAVKRHFDTKRLHRRNMYCDAI
jgi:hypothetical protein